MPSPSPQQLLDKRQGFFFCGNIGAMFDLNWLDSVFSDSTEEFLSPQNPAIGAEVEIRLRLFSSAPVNNVFLWFRPDNTEVIMPMERFAEDGCFAWYRVRISLEQPQLNYHFIISAKGGTYYFNQQGIHETQPLTTFDFVLLGGFARPHWVDGATFYQIFPDRFFDGDKKSNVRTGEYSYGGFQTLAKEWDEIPGEYLETGCLDFFGGDLAGIQSKLDYLQDLGVTALYLNPIFTAPSHHKYDCTDFFEVDKHFGGDSALTALVEACHKRSMHVMLDISVNHTGTSHRWFNREKLYGDNGAWQDPEGEAGELYLKRGNNDHSSKDAFVRWHGVDSLVTLDYGSQKLRDKVYKSADSVLKHWLKEPFSIDGWRFDVAYMMARYKKEIFYKEVWQEIRNHCKTVNPNCYLISEDWTDASEFLQGDMFDGVMNYYGFARPIRSWCGELDRYLANVNEPWQISPMTGATLGKSLGDNLAQIPHQMWNLQYNLLSSHDWHRLHTNPTLSFDSIRSAVAALFTFPGTASIYYGDEVGISGHLKSVEGCRFPMPWQENKWLPHYRQLYKTLSLLRRDNPALQRGSYKVLLTEGRVLAYARFLREDVVLTVLSREDKASVVSIPVALLGVTKGHFEDCLSPGPCHQVEDGRVLVPLAPEGTKVLKLKI